MAIPLGGSTATGRPSRLQRTSGPSAPAASPWAQPGAGLQSFGPGNDLRGTSILPADSQRTTTASGQADSAFGDVANYNLPAFNTLAPYQSKQTGTIAGLSTAPVAGPNFGTARGLMGGAMPRASALSDQAASAATGVGGISFNGGAASQSATDAKGMIPTGDVYQGDTGQVRKLALDRVSNLTTPDRQKLADEALSLLEEQSRPRFEVAQRQIGQKAAALGRVGSGVTTTELGDLGLQRERELSLARRGLANETAGLRLSDELDQLGATQSVFGDFAGADQAAEAAKVARARAVIDAGGLQLGVAQGETGAQEANARTGLQRASVLRDLGNDTWGRGMDAAGMEGTFARDTYGADVANEDRRLNVGRDNIRLAQDQRDFTEDADRFGFTSGVTERNAGWNAGLDRASFLTNRANTLSNREGALRGVDRNTRDELRGERTWQDTLANRAQDDRIQQAQFAQWLQSQNIGNASGLFGAGQTGNVGGAFNNQANFQSGQSQSGYDAAAQLAGLLPYLRNRGGAGGAPVGATGL